MRAAAGDGRGHEVPEPLPAGGPRDVHHLPEPGGAELEQRFAGGGVVRGHQRHGGDAREVVHQAAHLLDRVGRAAVHGEENAVHRPLPDGAHRLRHAVAVQEGEAAVAGGLHLQALGGEEHGGDGRPVGGDGGG